MSEKFLKMNLNSPEDYFAKYLSGEFTDEEKSNLVDWLKNNPEQAKVFAETKKIWNIAELDDEADDSKDAYLSFIQKREKEALKVRSRRIVSQTIRVAASIAILFSLSVSYYFINKTNLSRQSENYITTFAPLGEKSQITLSDGTKVWLNSGSSLKYPSGFYKSKRVVYLEGEGYFDVEKDKKHPFLVHAGGLTIKVLGTEFNVSCYNDDDEIKTTLIEGRVEILGDEEIKLQKSIILKPNESANYSRSENKVTVAKVSENEDNLIENDSVLTKNIKVNEPLEKIIPMVESITSWKNDQLVFDNVTLPEMAKRMERWYGVKIILKDTSLNKNIYSGKFIYNEPIEQVLDVINRTTPIQYTINKNTVIIYASE